MREESFPIIRRSPTSAAWLITAAVSLATGCLASEDAEIDDPEIDDPTSPPPPSEPRFGFVNHDGEPTRFGDSKVAPARAAASLSDRIARADLVFEGEVVNIEYRTSTVRSTDHMAVPHSFVTYRIDHAIKGGQPGETVTLRFLGGDAGDGRIMQVSDLPRIDLGDRDVLLVSANGISACPLVDCAQGRMRVVDGAIFSEHGHELFLDQDGTLRAGRWRDLPEVRTHRVGTMVLDHYRGDARGETPATSVAKAAAAATAPMTAATLRDALRALAGGTASNTSAAAVSVHPDAPFTIEKPHVR